MSSATVITATAFGGPEALTSSTEELPETGPREVTVELRAAAVNPIDYKFYSGAFGRDPAKLPIRLGLEGAGVVTAVGEEAAGRSGPISVGDEVIVAGPGANGLYATAVTIADTAVLLKPPELSWQDAAGLIVVGGTAIHLITALGVAAGDTVLIHGAAGSVGQIAVQLAVARGARVIGTASAARHDLLAGYGAEAVEYGPGLTDRVRALAPEGITSAIDTIGTDEAIDVSLELVADRRKIATIAGFQRASEGIQLLGGGPGADPGAEIRSAAWKELLPLAAAGKLNLVIARTFALTDAAQAHEFVAAGHAGGKAILLP